MGEGEREGNPSVSFADSIPQFSMVVPRLRTVPLLAARCSAPADFASLRVLGAPAASRPPLLASSLVVLPASLGSSYRPALRWPGIPGLRTPFGRVLAPPPLRGFDGYGLFPPQAAAFARPSRALPWFFLRAGGRLPGGFASVHFCAILCTGFSHFSRLRGSGKACIICNSTHCFFVGRNFIWPTQMLSR